MNTGWNDFVKLASPCSHRLRRHCVHVDCAYAISVSAKSLITRTPAANFEGLTLTFQERSGEINFLKMLTDQYQWQEFYILNYSLNLNWVQNLWTLSLEASMLVFTQHYCFMNDFLSAAILLIISSSIRLMLRSVIHKTDDSLCWKTNL